jgi:uncharacterized integral membrane protein
MAQEPARQSAVTPARIAIGILVALVVVFCLLNSQSVRMHWILTSTSQPLFVVIIVFSVLGSAAGYIAGRRHKPGR